jgi:hypothetical protein
MIRNIIFSNFESYLRYGIILCGGDNENESNSIFKLQWKVIQIIGGVSNRMSHGQIFKDYNILTLPSLYLQEVTCFKVFMEKNLDIHNHDKYGNQFVQ